MSHAGACVGPDIALSGSADVTGCDRTCTVGWHATVTDTWFFGDIGQDDDPEVLAAEAPRGVPGHIAAVGRIQAVGAFSQ
jgi:hypothetical protein